MDIREDIKRYQDTLSYASSKVNYSVGESIYMLPSDMSLKIKTGTVGYNNKILVSDDNFSLGKNDEVNEMAKISHQSTITHHELEKKPNITQAQRPTITHQSSQLMKMRKLPLYFLWQVVLQYGIFFDEMIKH